MEVSTLSTITLVPSTKKEAEDFSNSIVNEIQSGNLNALEFKMRAKVIEICLSKIEKAVKENILTEASRHGKSFNFKGFDIQEVETGTKYDYSNDTEWVRLNTLIKEREAYLKNLKKPIDVLVIETGEVIREFPPIKSSTTSLKFTLK